MLSLGFLTVAIGEAYEQFIGPYIASTLLTYPQATTEIRLPKAASWLAGNRKLHAGLRECFDDRFAILNAEFSHRYNRVQAGTVRWCIQPKAFQPDMVYVGDIDLVLCEAGLQAYFDEALSRPDCVPYVNSCRENLPGRFIGWQHVIKREPYFAVLTRKVLMQHVARMNLTNDEAFLFQMCKQVFGLPSPAVMRKMSGIHVSPNRPAVKTPGRAKGCHWEIAGQEQNFQRLAATPEWQALRPLFSPEYRKKLQSIYTRTQIVG